MVGTMRLEYIKMELNGFGEAHAPLTAVEEAMKLPNHQLRLEIRESVSQDSWSLYTRMPKWKLAIIHAAIYHALN
jgi:hypothetical protein